MSNEKKKVLLCTGAATESDNNENQYKKCLLESDIECEVLQVLQFEFVNLDELRDNLLDAACFSGLILTSPRAATAIAMTKKQYSLSMDIWNEYPTFCIGQATETVAREQAGLSNILGTDSGNAKNLANFIISIMKDNCKKPLLLPCSDIARETIPKMLSEQSMEVKKIIVYETRPREGLKEALKEALENPPHVLVFFSPSTVNNIVKALDNDISVLRELKIVPIGPVTEQALSELDIKVDGVSEKPEPQALTGIIKKII